MSKRMKNFAQAMQDAGLTIEDVAAAVQKSQKCVYAWRRGRSRPTSTDRANLVHLLGVDGLTLDRILEETKKQFEASLAKKA